MPVPQTVTAGAPALGLVEAVDQGGQDVGVLRVKIVTRPVEVGRHGRDVMHAVLSPQCLNLKHAGDLGDRIGVVCRLERAGKQAVLTNGLASKLRVDAARAKEQQLRGRRVARPRRGR